MGKQSTNGLGWQREVSHDVLLAPNGMPQTNRMEYVAQIPNQSIVTQKMGQSSDSLG